MLVVSTNKNIIVVELPFSVLEGELESTLFVDVHVLSWSYASNLWKKNITHSLVFYYTFTIYIY